MSDSCRGGAKGDSVIVNSERVSVQDWVIWGARRKSLEFIDYAYEDDQARFRN